MGTGRGQQADHGLVAELFLNFLHRHALHIDKGHADAPFDQSHEGVGRVAGHDDAVAAVFFKTLGAVVHRKGWIFAAFKQALGAVRNLRVLLDHELEVFLIVLCGRCLDDLVVKVDRGGRPQTPDHAHLKGLGKTGGIGRQQTLGVVFNVELFVRAVVGIDQTHRELGLQFFEEPVRAQAAEADHVGAGLLKIFHRIEVIDLAHGFLLGGRLARRNLEKAEIVENHSHRRIPREDRRLDFQRLVAVVTGNQPDDFHFASPIRCAALSSKPRLNRFILARRMRFV